ncbi:MAG: efflux RND transporter periplasmic adaptor subunit [Candidatus Hydrogenedentes bacterium]|nr:efflux RND transporter periplasmic adaptor subunit [Candidatus Hydrogenedentota bacterium]
MANPETQSISIPLVRRRKGRLRLVVKLAVVAVLALGVLRFFTKAETVTGLSGTTFTVARGTLKIDVTEGGSIDALESQEIKSEVQGQTKILSIVEEGYSVTPEDVENGKVLVELDATELLEKQISEELEYQNSLAAYTEAREAYDIQINQNRSDITAAELEVKFALMDLEKYLGKVAAKGITEQLPKEEAMASSAPMPDLEEVLKSVMGETSGKPEEKKAESPPAAAPQEGQAVAPASTDVPASTDAAATTSPAGAPASADAPASTDVAAQAVPAAPAAPAPQAAPAAPAAPAPQAAPASQAAPAAETPPAGSDASKDEAKADGGRKPGGRKDRKEPGGALEKNQEDFSAMAASVLKEATSSANSANARYAETLNHQPHVTIDFAKYANIEMLGDGEAGQKLRKLEDDLMMQQAELGLAKTTFEGTKRLSEREFVTKNELETERIKVQRNEIGVQSADTSRQLFLNYEFPKESEKLLSAYQESYRKLERAKRTALSKLAQAEARLKSSQARFALQSKRRGELQQQIQKCKIKAERPGLVVYANQESWRGEDRVQEGAMVHEQQKIITIPDMSQMGAKVNIHESVIKNIQRDQTATIRVDAYQDDVLTGKVMKVGVLPDSENRWLNPDLKVYETKVSIEGWYPWLKPGMSAQVEVHVKELPDVVYVPIQAVSSSEGKRVCYASRLAGTEKRVVEVGEFNNEFIEIKKGLSEGEVVLLRAPVTPEDAQGKKKEDQKKTPAVEKKPAEPAAVPAAAAPAA